MISTENYQSLKCLLELAASQEAGCRQQEINQLFEQFDALPNTADYLVAYLLDDNMPLDTRSMAAWVLKTQIKQKRLLLETQRDFLLKRYFEEPERGLATVLSLLYTQSVKEGKDWTELIVSLLGERKRAIVTPILEMICQDCPDSLVSNELFEELLKYLLESLKLGEAEAVAGLSCINQFIIFPSELLEERLSELLENLSVFADRENALLQKRVLECLSSLVYSYPHEMMQVMPSVMDFMLRVMERHGDPLDLESFEQNLALDACDFWMTLVERDSLLYESFAEQINELVKGNLGRLLPVLLKAMTYAEDDLELQENMEGNVMQPDDLRSMLPQHYHISEEEELDEYGSSGWGLRKCAGNTLDRLASCIFGDSAEVVHGLLIPLINEKFAESHRDWRLLESGIMAIGTIAEGAAGVLIDQVPQLIEFLAQREGRLPLVRATASWALSRLPLGKFARKTIAFLCQLVLCESSKRVQRVSIVFLQSVLGKYPSGWKAQDMLQLILEAAGKCQIRNRLQLCELMTFIGDEQGFDQVSNDLFIRMLQFLIDLWSSLPKELIYPVVEAVSAVSTASGERVPREAAVLIYEKCMNELCAGEQEEEYLVALLDVITGLLPTNVMSVQQFERQVLYPMFTECSGNAAILQSIFGFVGDAAKKGGLESELVYLEEYCRMMETVSIEFRGEEEEGDEWVATRNNAVWALGETVYRGVYKPTASFIKYLISLFRVPSETTSSQGKLLDNAAVTLGRSLAIIGYEQLDVGVLETAMKRVLGLLEGEERTSALCGFSRFSDHHHR